MTAFVGVNDRTKTVGKKLSSTSATAVYKNNSTNAPAKGVAMSIANIHTLGVDVTLEWYDAQDISGVGSATAFTLGGSYTLAAKTTLTVDLHGMRLGPGDELRITASIADKIHAVTTVFETLGRSPLPGSP